MRSVYWWFSILFHGGRLWNNGCRSCLMMLMNGSWRWFLRNTTILVSWLLATSFQHYEATGVQPMMVRKNSWYRLILPGADQPRVHGYDAKICEVFIDVYYSRLSTVPVINLVIMALADINFQCLWDGCCHTVPRSRTHRPPSTSTLEHHQSTW